MTFSDKNKTKQIIIPPIIKEKPRRTFLFVSLLESVYRKIERGEEMEREMSKKKLYWHY